MSRCSICRDVGWILDANGAGTVAPLALELISCPVPDCTVSGQHIAVLSLAEARFKHVSSHPSNLFVMSVAAAVVPCPEETPHDA